MSQPYSFHLNKNASELIKNIQIEIYYFYTFLKGRLIRRGVKYAIISYILSSVLYLLIFEDIFFRELSQFSNIVGTLLLLTVIVIFYFQLLKSRHIG